MRLAQDDREGHPREPGRLDQIQKLDLILGEGPNDVIRLDTLGVPSVALCSNNITREQAEKAATPAKELGNGVVTIMLDCDEEGLNGMKQCLGYIAQLTPVRMAWTDRMHMPRSTGYNPSQSRSRDGRKSKVF